MTSFRAPGSSVFVLVVALVGCSAATPADGGSGTDSGGGDSGSIDSGSIDSGSVDSGSHLDSGTDAGGAVCTDDFGVGASCGNGVCDVTETCLTCTVDCGCCGAGDAGPDLGGGAVCGDHACNMGESCTTCPDDCGVC